jgi:hypothetical protein
MNVTIQCAELNKSEAMHLLAASWGGEEDDTRFSDSAREVYHERKQEVLDLIGRPAKITITLEPLELLPVV